MSGLVVTALIVGLVGLILYIRGKRSRSARGFEPGETVALDDRTLFSRRLGLVGRPDRLIRQGSLIIPEEWKSSRRVYPGHRLQLAVYFLLIEEEFGQRPPHGFVVLADGSRVRVENSDELRAEVLAIAQDIRAHRRRMNDVLPVRQPAAMCRMCGQRPNCSRASC